ncbi:hypothetical protein H310_05180 [Aphanomyces invadans]|uniref:Uncharacterized protein n=1 Tax=Aphanomyces invadans TaxID=157072 RepID=A0A024UC82_9STRA|nr:hypothetical protein H310_05180 [Aphanomyces invadans]ETW03815.1 hypothetical protein H310_05180 [Aphanomyces invadans]|eukprot:XP_008868044.1 hypothetical protein H310_05180 [Aphanomyces invadans]
MQLVQTTAAAAWILLSTALVAADTPTHCSLDDLDSLKHSLHGNDMQKLCETDIGDSLDRLLAGSITQAQADAFSNSTACRSEYETIVTSVATAASTCVELRTYLPRVTWTMVTSVVELVAYPRASVDCDLDALQSKGMTLSTSSNLLPCLAATGLASTFMTHTTPESAQWTLAGQTPSCRALFNEAKALIMALPPCNLRGINTHAVDHVEIDQVVPWLVLATDIQYTPNLFETARALWAATSKQHEALQAQVDGSWVIGLAALAALVLHLRRGQTATSSTGHRHERTALLHRRNAQR